MSKKNEKFTIGTPNEIGWQGPARDEWGLSTDPAEHADLNCTNCNGRGFYLVLLGTKEPGVYDRAKAVCGCAAKKRAKRRDAVLHAYKRTEKKTCCTVDNCNCLSSAS